MSHENNDSLPSLFTSMNDKLQVLFYNSWQIWWMRQIMTSLRNPTNNKFQNSVITKLNESFVFKCVYQSVKHVTR